MCVVRERERDVCVCERDYSVDNHGFNLYVGYRLFARKVTAGVTLKYRAEIPELVGVTQIVLVCFVPREHST